MVTNRSRKRLAWGALALSLAALLVLAWTQGGRFAPVAVGSRVPAYTAQTLDGRAVSLQSLRGKVVVLNIWATWCRPCRAEMPALERLHAQLGDKGLEIVAVSVDTPLGTFGPSGNAGGDVKGYVTDMGLTFTILHDTMGEEADRELRPLGLQRGDIVEFAHPSQPPGIIIAQDPLPGQQMRQGGVVQVAVSAGLPRVQVPNVVGFDVARATAVLSQLGLTAEQRTEINERPAGTVIRIMPEAGQNQPVPGRVILVVSEGPPPAPAADSTAPPDSLVLRIEE